ncbi:MAG TPA: TfoX/Sxy family protein [Caulobacter sp.]|nr:TfoX/Sxy family protein [Caulobacter sp.]
MAVSRPFLDHLSELLAGLGPLTVKTMFGGASLQVDGAAFALVFGETLYLKVDDENRAAFEAEGAGPFVYAMKDGRKASLGYWSLPERALDDPDEAVRWARLGVEAAFRAKRSKKKKGRATRDDIGPGPWDG